MIFTGSKTNPIWSCNIAAVLLFLLSTLHVQAASIHPSKLYDLKVEEIVTGLDHPWGMARLPDGKLLITERSGALWLVSDNRKKMKVKNQPKSVATGQGGLLDVVLDPNYAKNGLVYFSYTKGSLSENGTAIARGKLILGDKPKIENLEDIFIMERMTGSRHHFGSRIVFAPDGTLFFTIGDRGDQDRAQDPFDHAGSVLRINSDGSVPADNPFKDGKGAAPEIWSIGHRNPQGAALDASTGKVWTVEHGARGGDEINQPKASKNYGWPIISYGTHYSGAPIGIGTETEGMEQPVHFWDPSIAPSGLAFYTGSLFPKWQGNLFVGALKDAKLVRLTMRDGKVVDEEALLNRKYGRIRDVRSFDDGALWILTDSGNGKVLRITPAE